MKFWTVQQYPIMQAIHYDGIKIDAGIPDHVPKTPTRQVMCVGQYNDNLVVARRASIELWSKDGSELIKNLYSPNFYGIHDVIQHKENLIVLSTGVDLITMIDIEGNVLWEWWGYKNGLCSEPMFLNDTWQNKQFSTDRVAVEDSIHMNSIYIKDNNIYTSALRRSKIYRISINEQGYEEVFPNTVKGCHAAIPYEDSFIYGHERGIVFKGEMKALEHTWVKTIKEVEGGYVYTHDAGVTHVDKDWNTIETVEMFAPYTLAFLEIWS